MTNTEFNQLVAIRFREWHLRRFGFLPSNVGEQIRAEAQRGLKSHKRR
jgi:hypothetical protein